MTGTIAQEIERLLSAALAPTALAVINDSARHHGHAGDDGSGESHFTVEIASAAFTGKSRLERQRMVIGDCATEIIGKPAVTAPAVPVAAAARNLRREGCGCLVSDMVSSSGNV